MMKNIHRRLTVFIIFVMTSTVFAPIVNAKTVTSSGSSSIVIPMDNARDNQLISGDKSEKSLLEKNTRGDTFVAPIPNDGRVQDDIVTTAHFIDNAIIHDTQSLDSADNSSFEVMSASSASTGGTVSSFDQNSRWGSLPKIDKPDVDESTGALTYRYAFQVPPGRNGFGPQLSLLYNSHNADIFSHTGYGWSFDIPSVSRLNKTGTDVLYSADNFISSLSGELIKINATTYVPRIDTGDNLKYVFSNNIWRVTTKEGMTYIFGETAGARQDDPQNAGRVYRWMVERVEDNNGNYITYTYDKESGDMYPSKIRYTGYGADMGMFEIRFMREARPTFILYKPAFRVETKQRISKIEIWVAGVQAREYVLGYGAHALNGASRLMQIIEVGYDEFGIATSLPPVKFSYTEEPTWTLKNFPELPVVYRDLATGNIYRANPYGIDFFDVNGDSYSDLVAMYRQQFIYGGPSVNIQKVFLFNPRTQGYEEFTGITPPCCMYDGNYNGHWHESRWGLYMDVNGDSRTDMVRTSGGWWWNMDSLVAIATEWISASLWNTGFPIGYWSNTLYPKEDWYARSLSGDLNGDGFSDALRRNLPRSTNPNPGTDVAVNDGGLRWRGGSWIAPGDTGIGVVLADVNGDGLVDMLRGRAGYYDVWLEKTMDSDYAVYLNTGNGFIEDNNFGVRDMNMRAQQRFVYVDMNGDGVA